MVLTDNKDSHITIIADKDVIGVDIRLVATMQPKTDPRYDLTIFTTGGHAVTRQNIPKIGIEALVREWCGSTSWSL